MARSCVLPSGCASHVASRPPTRAGWTRATDCANDVVGRLRERLAELAIIAAACSSGASRHSGGRRLDRSSRSLDHSGIACGLGVDGCHLRACPVAIVKAAQRVPDRRLCVLRDGMASAGHPGRRAIKGSAQGCRPDRRDGPSRQCISVLRPSTTDHRRSGLLHFAPSPVRRGFRETRTRKYVSSWS